MLYGTADLKFLTAQSLPFPDTENLWTRMTRNIWSVFSNFWDISGNMILLYISILAMPLGSSVVCIFIAWNANWVYRIAEEICEEEYCVWLQSASSLASVTSVTTCVFEQISLIKFSLLFCLQLVPLGSEVLRFLFNYSDNIHNIYLDL